MTPAQATKVYDAGSGGGKSWIHDIAVDSQGLPVMTFARFPTDTDHRYHYAKWNGTAWEDRELTAAGGTIAEKPREINYSGGITLDHTNPSAVLLSRRIGSVNEIERWTTASGGTTWEREAITADSTVTQVRPIAPRGLGSGERLGILWMAGRYPAVVMDVARLYSLRKKNGRGSSNIRSKRFDDDSTSTGGRKRQWLQEQ